MHIQTRLKQALDILLLKEKTTYRVAHDSHAYGIGINIVVIGGLIASMAQLLVTREGVLNIVLFPMLYVGVLLLMSWMLWMMSKILKGKATYGNMLRTLSYASLLFWISWVSYIPLIGTILLWLLKLWALVITTHCVKVVEKVDWLRAGIIMVIPTLIILSLQKLIQVLG